LEKIPLYFFNFFVQKLRQFSKGSKMSVIIDKTNMKKIIAMLVVLGVVLIVGVAVFLMPKSTTHLTQSIPAGEGVVKIRELHNSNIRIIPGRTSKITMYLEGPEDELKKIRFFRVGGDTEIDVSDEWKGVSGTITVPEGTWVDLNQPDENEAGEKKTSDFIRLGGGSSITIKNDKVIVTGSGGGTTPPPPVIGEGEGEGEVEEEPVVTLNPVSPPLPPPVIGEGEGEGESEDEEGPTEPQTTQYAPEGPDDPHIRCSIALKQTERNECCQTAFMDEPHPDCSYDGYWLFNYHTRLCYYHCFHPCHLGDEATQDACCAEQYYYDTTSPCIGDWVYNDATNGCSYECMDAEDLEEYFGEGETVFTDFISEACSTHSNPDLCCDYNLKNDLSIGPHPGFPDCIGQWDFNNATSTCEFECSSYGETLEILELLKEQRGE